MVQPLVLGPCLMDKKTGQSRSQRQKNAQNSTSFKSGVQWFSVLSGNTHSSHWLRQNLPMSWAIFSVSIQRTSLLPLRVLCQFIPCSSYHNRATCSPDKAHSLWESCQANWEGHFLHTHHPQEQHLKLFMRKHYLFWESFL